MNDDALKERYARLNEDGYQRHLRTLLETTVPRVASRKYPWPWWNRRPIEDRRHAIFALICDAAPLDLLHDSAEVERWLKPKRLKRAFSGRDALDRAVSFDDDRVRTALEQNGELSYSLDDDEAAEGFKRWGSALSLDEEYDRAAMVRAKLHPDLLRVLDAYGEHRTERAAAAALGMKQPTYHRKLTRARETARALFDGLEISDLREVA